MTFCTKDFVFYLGCTLIQLHYDLFSALRIIILLKIGWSTCNLQNFDGNCCETMNFRCNLSENEILICNNVVGNSMAFLLSSNVQRNKEVHKTLTQIFICGTVLIVAVSVPLTNDSNLSYISFLNHTTI